MLKLLYYTILSIAMAATSHSVFKGLRLQGADIIFIPFQGQTPPFSSSTRPPAAERLHGIGEVVFALSRNAPPKPSWAGGMMPTAPISIRDTHKEVVGREIAVGSHVATFCAELFFWQE